ncbi:MAG: OmpA family protein [Acidobacteriota bacterium]|nr:OmpA family protein [Acidobacteriota bacterium]MDH3522033.1 OmpA family protein [Acidobacteriota bacterium]
MRQILWGRSGGAPASAVRRQVDAHEDPARFETVHQNLFVNAPTTTGAARQPWVAGTTDVQIESDFRASVQAEVEANPLRVVGSMSAVTTQADAENAAIGADADLHAAFPQIPTQLSEAQLRGRVTVFAPDFAPQNAPTADFLANWIDNQLPLRTTIEDFDLDPGDPDYQRLVNGLATSSATFPVAGILASARTIMASQGWTAAQIASGIAGLRADLAGKSWSWLFNRMASRTAAFHGQGVVFVSQSLPAAKRRPTLLHELVHAYAHADYRRWVAATTSPRVFNEGFTETLTRQALTPQELAARRSYQGSVDVVRQRILAFVSMDDLARAFYGGEVWRLEGRSQVAQEMFERQIGIAAGATRAEEISQSRTGAGFVLEVTAGAHYRLANLGSDESTPKPEHETFLRDTILPRLRADAALHLRFVGHADATGAASHNLALSRRRAAAFYRLVESLGVPRAQLRDRGTPAGGGDTAPTAANTDVHGRAFNRRVELFVER